MKTKRLGDYEVLGELGRGGSAQVFRARGPGGEIVAVKLLAERADNDSYARFAREERLLASLGEAEGFVPLVATGMSERGPFFVMPLLEAGTLRDRLDKGTLGYEETLQLGRALATAIGWAHERGIVHRDLKPENILFTKDGRPLIADLGIAKHFVDATSRSESITEQGAFLGTPLYMAPEQLDCSKSVDARADIFALGALLYECLTGAPPFAAATMQETIARVTTSEYKRIQDARPDTPLDLAYPIGTALNTNPEFRYANGFAFAHALGARIPQRARLQPTVQESPRARRRRSPVLWLLPFLGGAAALLAGHGAPAPTPVNPAPVASASAPAPVATKASVTTAKGWFGESMPSGLRQGAERPIYIYDTKKGLELALVYVPSGDFLMGAINGGQHEKPIHTHPMPRGYYISRTEVTWDEYRAFCRASGRAVPTVPSWPITGAHPVVNVSWDDATTFCEWAGLALPTEAEWEKAARGGDDARHWPWGDVWLEGVANILDVSSSLPESEAKETFSDGWPNTAPVGSSPRGSSVFGSMDMAGNVWEWTEDRYDSTIYLAYSNGLLSPPPAGDKRVLRGGSWTDGRFKATVTFRYPAPPDKFDDQIGFRPILRTTR